MKPRVLALAGSLRRDSYNKKLVRIAAAGATAAGAEVTFVDLAELTLPLYDADIEKASGLPDDVRTLKEQGHAVFRPAAFFLTDGQPTDDPEWRAAYARLVDQETNPVAPNIIACGVGEARARTILDIATRPEFAFVATPGTELGLAIAEFSVALTRSIVASARAAAADRTELVVERPNNFVMAVDVV
jgi:uncharacterized protein YegL